jgi:hypothetical protein
VLRLIAKSAIASAALTPPVLSFDADEATWVESRYAALGAVSTVTREPIPAQPPAPQWEELLSRDELRGVMGRGRILAGFREGGIGFPPSYRRVAGQKGECGDYCDEAVLSAAFTTRIVPQRGRGGPPPVSPARKGAEEEKEKDEPHGEGQDSRVKIRTPS